MSARFAARYEMTLTPYQRYALWYSGYMHRLFVNESDFFAAIDVAFQPPHYWRLRFAKGE
jgi:hypothetical protein